MLPAYDITINNIEFSFEISYYINSEYNIRIVRARGSVRNVGSSDLNIGLSYGSGNVFVRSFSNKTIH